MGAKVVLLLLFDKKKNCCVANKELLSVVRPAGSLPLQWDKPLCSVQALDLVGIENIHR